MKTLASGTFRGVGYRDAGRGFPVMLVHGFPVDGSVWDYQAARLKKKFRLLIPDLPGSGSSPLTQDLTMEDLAACLHDILEQEGVDRCIMIGHSMGGYATLAFAEKYASRLQGFGLFHSTAFADSEEKRQGRLRSIDMMERYGAGVFLRQMLPGLFARKYRSEQKPALQALLQSKEDADTKSFTAYYRAMMERPDRTAVLREARTPVLFVIGKEDTAAPAAHVLKQVTLPPVSEVHLFDDAAHMAMVELPEASTRVLDGFLSFCVDYPFGSHNTAT
jgi:pimeloyl-ACP methyl ester carboxylesterase